MSTIIPIALKSGAVGSTKSLHQFMFDKNLKLADCSVDIIRRTHGDLRIGSRLDRGSAAFRDDAIVHSGKIPRGAAP